MNTAVILWLSGVVVFDMARRRVPNLWIVAGALAALAALALDHSPLDVRWDDALVGSLGAFCLFLGCYAAGWMGAGDVKYAGVLGLWFGWQPLLAIASDAGLLAGLHAVIWLAWAAWLARPGLRRRRPATDGPSTGIGSTNVSNAPPSAGQQIPYAGYLSIAALLWLLRVPTP